MKIIIVVALACLCLNSVVSSPVGKDDGQIRGRRATSFVCSSCPFICPHGGACLHGSCVCLKPLGPPRPGDKFPTPVVRP